MKNYSINFVPACILAALWICLTTVDATEPKDVKKGASIPTLQSIRIEPPSIELSHARSKQSLVVTASYTDGSTRDVTSEAIAELSPKQLATWESEFLLPSSNGNGKVKFSFGGQSHSVPVVVKNVDVNPTVEFRNEVMQVLTVDDMRVSNPPSNPELLDYLGERLAESNYDIKVLIREICNSRTYQIETKRNEINRLDEREFSHQKIRRLRAEVLLDCITQVTGTTERLPGLPPGSRAVQVADGLAAHYFLTTFGRSNRSTPCTCEVKTSPTLSQALHLLNGETTGGKIREGNVVGRLLESGISPLDVAKRLYQLCFTRECSASEIAGVESKLKEYSTPKEGLEDLFWALLNSNEFVFNH